MLRLKKNKNYKQYTITKAVRIRRKNKKIRYFDVMKVIRILNRGRIESNFGAAQMSFFFVSYYLRYDSDLRQGQFIFIS